MNPREGQRDAENNGRSLIVSAVVLACAALGMMLWDATPRVTQALTWIRTTLTGYFTPPLLKVATAAFMLGMAVVLFGFGLVSVSRARRRAAAATTSVVAPARPATSAFSPQRQDG